MNNLCFLEQFFEKDFFESNVSQNNFAKNNFSENNFLRMIFKMIFKKYVWISRIWEEMQGMTDGYQKRKMGGCDSGSIFMLGWDNWMWKTG